MTQQDIQHYLRTNREARNLSIVEIAQQLNVNKNTYNDYETGKRKIPVTFLLDATAFYNDQLQIIPKKPVKAPKTPKITYWYILTLDNNNNYTNNYIRSTGTLCLHELFQNLAKKKSTDPSQIIILNQYEITEYDYNKLSTL